MKLMRPTCSIFKMISFIRPKIKAKIINEKVGLIKTKTVKKSKNKSKLILKLLYIIISGRLIWIIKTTKQITNNFNI